MSQHACPGCKALFSTYDGPVHNYMESSPACWHAYGQVLTREYESQEFFAVHRLTVDSYAVQHPGGDLRPAVQSVGVHLARLCLFFERGLSPEDANAAMLRVGKAKASMFKLSRPQSLGTVTVVDVLAARGAEQHIRVVRQWASSAWAAWSEHHETVRRWASAT